MRKIYTYTVIGLLFLGLSNCVKGDIKPPILSAPEVSLKDLKVGQQSAFVRYKTSCADLNGSFSYTGDTLILEVIEENGSLFFKESLTAESPMFLNGDFQEPIIYPVSSDGLVLSLPERDASALFFFYANDVVQLFPKDQVTLSQDACKLFLDSDPFIGNDIGKFDKFHVGPLTFNDKTAISCEPFFNLDAYLIYDADRLYMSHVITIEDFNGQVFDDVVLGWVKI